MTIRVRRFALVMAGTAAAALAIVAACGFPSPVLRDDLDDGGGPSGFDGATDTGPIEASVVDAARTDAGGRIEGDACASPCDCDGDLFFDRTKVGCEDAGGRDASNDCDDHLRAAHPGQTEYFSDREQVDGGDWNCDGIPEKEEKVTGLGDCFGLLNSDCTSKKGFSDDPGCGKEGTYVECGFPPPLSLTCGVVKSQPGVPQGCR